MFTHFFEVFLSFFGLRKKKKEILLIKKETEVSLQILNVEFVKLITVVLKPSMLDIYGVKQARNKSQWFWANGKT